MGPRRAASLPRSPSPRRPLLSTVLPPLLPPPLPLPLLLPPGRALRPAATTPAIGCLGNSKTEDQRNEEKAQLKANKKMEKQL